MTNAVIKERNEKINGKVAMKDTRLIILFLQIWYFNP
jgi:hypothetical protein